jgi:hypothetical protein
MKYAKPQINLTDSATALIRSTDKPQSQHQDAPGVFETTTAYEADE